MKDGFAEAARLHFAGRYNGHYCDVRWFEEDDLLRVLVLHGSKPETKNVDQEGAEDTLKFREIVQSTIEYDERRSAISVGSKSAADAKKLVKLIKELNDALGITSVIVTHDVKEVLSIADYAYIIANRKVVAHGTPEQLREEHNPEVEQFLKGLPDGPVPFHFPAGDLLQDL